MTDDPTRLVRVLKALPATTDLEVIGGYMALHAQEVKYTQLALREVPEAARIWFRYLTLWDQMLRKPEYTSPTTELDAPHLAWQLRLRMSATAAGTAKLALDAALAGYYSQAGALTRHLLETWRVMAYVRFTPDAAWGWYSRDGLRPAVEPATTTMTAGIRRGAKREKDDVTQNNLPIIEKIVSHLNAGAHPSGMAVAQSDTGRPGHFQMGANIDSFSLNDAMSTGILGVAMILRETGVLLSDDPAWQDEWRQEWNALWADADRWQQTRPRRPLSETAKP